MHSTKVKAKYVYSGEIGRGNGIGAFFLNMAWGQNLG